MLAHALRRVIKSFVSATEIKIEHIWFDMNKIKYDIPLRPPFGTAQFLIMQEMSAVSTAPPPQSSKLPKLCQMLC